MVVEVSRMVHGIHLKSVILVRIQHLKVYPVHLWLQPQETVREWGHALGVDSSLRDLSSQRCPHYLIKLFAEHQIHSAFLLLGKYHKLGCTLPIQRRTGGTVVELQLSLFPSEDFARKLSGQEKSPLVSRQSSLNSVADSCFGFTERFLSFVTPEYARSSDLALAEETRMRSLCLLPVMMGWLWAVGCLNCGRKSFLKSIKCNYLLYDRSCQKWQLLLTSQLPQMATTCFMTEVAKNGNFLLTSQLPQMATICLITQVAKNGNCY